MENKTIDELYLLIGEKLFEDDNDIFPKKKNELILAGKKWWENKKKSIANELCPHLDNKLIENIKNDSYQLELVIADFISGIILNIPPFLVSALIIKHGIENLCSDEK